MGVTTPWGRERCDTSRVSFGRRLILIRHAKAEPFAATDLARELTDRGRRDAEAAGRFLCDRGLAPDHAVVSPAVRTRQTWEVMERILESGAQVVYDDSVYSGSPEVVLESLRYVPPDTEVLVFVGHQPTIGYLTHMLEDGAGDPEALHQLLHGFPTSATAVLEVDLPWEELAPETARLVAFHSGTP